MVTNRQHGARKVRNKRQTVSTKRGASTRKFTDLMHVLSMTGALDILGMAEDGLAAHKGTHMSVGISRRQYYARLSELAKAGLVDKVGGIYRQTRLGSLVWRNYIPRLESAFMDIS